MINPILNNILIVSLTCSGVAILLLIVRKLIGKNSGAWWRSIIWVLLLIRLCIPLIVESPIGIIGDSTIPNSINDMPVVEYNTANSAETTEIISNPNNSINLEEVNNNPVNNLTTDYEMNSPNSFSWWTLINDIYLFGLIISVGIFIVRIVILNKKYMNFKICRDKEILSLFKQIKNQLGIKRKIFIIIDDDNHVPALFGLIYPHIIIPKSILNSTNVAELEYILIHELTHYKQRDIAKLWLLEFVTCIHWFNPLLHMIKPIIVQDIELACDEKVLTRISNNQYSEYGKVLVNFSTKEKSEHPLVVTSNFAGKRGNKLMERLVMIKKFKRKQIVAIGAVLLIALSAILVACTSLAQDENSVDIEDAVNVRYLDYNIVNIEEQYLDSFISQFNDLDLIKSDSTILSQNLHGDFTFYIAIDSKSYTLFRDKDNNNRFYLEHSKGKDEPWDYYEVISNEFNILLNEIENDILEHGELIRYDKDSYEELISIINGDVTIDVIKSSKRWSFYERDNHYLCRAIFPDNNEYHITVSSEKLIDNRYLDYEYDYVKVYNADKNEYIENPTIDEFIAFVNKSMQKPTADPAQDGIPTKDLNAFVGYGESVCEQIMDVVSGYQPIGHLIEEWSMPYIDGAFKQRLITTTDEYIVFFMAEENVDRELFFNTDTMTLTIESVGKWTVENPDVEYLFENMMTPYLEQQPMPETADVNTMENPPGIYAVYYNASRQKTMVDLPEDVFRKAYDLIYVEPSNYIDLEQYEDTEDEFFTTDIYLNSNGEFNGGRIEILINSKQEYAMRFMDYGWRGVLAGDACDEIIEIVKSQTDWNFIGTDKIKDVVKAEITIDGEVISTLTDAGKLAELEKMLSSAECIGYTPKTLMYKPILTLTLQNGSQLQMYLDLYNDLMMLGSSFHYDYGPGYIDGASINKLPNLLSLFGMDEFSYDLTSGKGNIADLDIIYAMDVVRDYFKAIEDENVSLIAECLHPDRYDADQTFFDEFDGIAITLDTVNDYSIEHQSAFNYHLDNGDAMLIIVQVDFTVEYLVDNPNTTYNEGQYTGWNIILVRERLGSPWKIYDQGY